MKRVNFPRIPKRAYIILAFLFVVGLFFSNPVKVSAATVSGTARQDAFGGSPIPALTQVSLLVDGGSLQTYTTTGNGQFSFTGVTLSSSSIITLFVEGGSNRGVTVIHSDTSNLSNMDIYQDYIVIRNENGTSAVTLADLDTANNNDPDITAMYTNSATPTFASGKVLYVYPGASFSPGGTLNISGHLEIQSGATLNAGSSTINLTGNFINAGTFTHSGTFNLTNNSNGGTQTITPTSATTFSTLSRVENTDDFNSSIFINGDITISTALVLNGTDANDMIFLANGFFTPANLTFTGSSTFSGDYLDVSNSTVVDNSSGITLPLSPANSSSTDGGTTGWFGADATAPIISQVTPVTTPTNNQTPSYTFTTNEAGTISYGGSCTSATTSASVGSNTITFSTLSAGTYSNCTITVTDASSNASSPLSVTSFTIDLTAPTVTNITSSTNNGSYKAGQSISVQVTFSESVTVTGTPQLTLETGGTDRTINYVSGSPGATLTFTYTIQAGDTSSDLDYVGTTSLALNSGTIRDSATNNATLTLYSPGGGSPGAGSLAVNKALVIDTTAPTISEVTPVSTPTSDPTPNYTFTTDEAGTITYGGSCSSVTTSALSGSNTITFLSLSDGTYSNCTITVTDTATNASNTLAVTTFVVDASVPTITNITSSTDNGSYNLGDPISIQVTFSESVTVASGTPQLTLETGTTDRTINYVSGSPGTTLTFTYTIQAGDTSSDLDYVGTTSLTLNGATIRDAGNNNATLTLYAPGGGSPGAGSLAVNKALIIDTTTPTISEVTPVTTPTADPTPSYTFTTNEAGTASYGGDCSTTSSASVSSGSNTISFNTLSSATHSNCTVTVTDGAGNASTPLSVTSFTVDADAPRVASISTNKADGTYTIGEVIDIDVTFSEAVSDLGGGVAVTLETGDTDRTCSFAMVTSITGTCNYTVQSGDTTSDLSGTVSGTIVDQVGNALVNFTPTGNNINTNHAIVIDTTNPSISTFSPADNATGVSLNANLIMTFDGPVTVGTGNITIKTTTGNTTVETIDVTSGLVTGGGTAIITINPSTTLTGLTEYYVLVDATAFDDVATNSYAGIASTTAWSFTTSDGTAPTITNVSSDKTNGSYTVGEVIDIDVTFSEAVTSTGNVTVTLETGTTDRTCTFTVSNASTGTCNYTVQTGDTTSDLTVNTISGTIADQSSNAMTDFNPITNLAANKALVIDTTAPTISEVTPVTTPTTNQTPSYTFTTNEGGTITYGGSCTSGTPSASVGSNTIAFSTLGDGTYSNCTIRVTDAVGNLSNLLTVTTFVVDINTPTVSNVTSSPTSGAYKLGQTVTIHVVFSEAVTVASGTPQLTLETGATDRTINYVSGSPGTTLVFTYTVQAGDTASDLDYTGTTALALNGATIRDVVAHNATLTLATPGASGSLGANANNIIDTTAPVISEVTPVTTPSTDATPNYVFTTDEAGTISYGGSCSSGTTSASVGSNTITFSSLSNGTYSNCTIIVTDVATNASNTLSVTEFIMSAASASSGGSSGGGGGAPLVCWAGTTGIYPNCVTTTVPVCAPGQLYSTTTGQPCNASVVPASVVPVVPVAPNLIPSAECTAIIKYPIVLGKDNLPADVNNLVTFLNTYEGERLVLDGVYNIDDMAAVNRFQVKYWDEIIAPFGGKTTTGNVGNYTKGKINAMNCAKNIGCPFFTGVQKYKTTGGEQLTRIQTYLNLLMGANLQENSYNLKVFNAIKAYQTVYKTKILKPYGLSRGTGNWGVTTVKTANEMVGCIQK